MDGKDGHLSSCASDHNRQRAPDTARRGVEDVPGVFGATRSGGAGTISGDFASWNTSID
jgi:hypothetical protein